MCKSPPMLVCSACMSCVSVISSSGSALLEGRVVGQDVEPAKDLQHVPGRLLAERRVAHVAGDGEAAPPFLLDGASCAGGIAVLSQIEDRDVFPSPANSAATARPMPESPW